MPTPPRDGFGGLAMVRRTTLGLSVPQPLEQYVRRLIPAVGEGRAHEAALRGTDSVLSPPHLRRGGDSWKAPPRWDDGGALLGPPFQEEAERPNRSGVPVRIASGS